jgi:hypothetical protein
MASQPNPASSASAPTILPIRSLSEGANHPTNLAAFCEHHYAPKGAQSIDAEKATQKIDAKIEASMRTFLEGCDYVSVLRYLWNEPDQRRRLAWLRDHHQLKVLHAPLYYELAVEELATNPAAQTLVEVSLPLLKKARALTDVASSCCRLPALTRPSELGEKMDTVYKTSLNQILQDNLGTTIEYLLKENKGAFERATAKSYRGIAEDISTKSLPPPVWAGHYRPGSFSVDHVLVIPASEQQAMGKQMAKELLALAAKMERELSPPRPSSK